MLSVDFSIKTRRLSPERGADLEVGGAEVGGGGESCLVAVAANIGGYSSSIVGKAVSAGDSSSSCVVDIAVVILLDGETADFCFFPNEGNLPLNGDRLEGEFFFEGLDDIILSQIVAAAVDFTLTLPNHEKTRMIHHQIFVLLLVFISCSLIGANINNSHQSPLFNGQELFSLRRMTTTTSNNNGGFSNLADVLTRFTNQKAASQLLPACDLITNIDDGKYSGLNRLEFIKFPRYRTLGLLKTNSRSSQQYDITIVTQLSLGRLSLLPDLCKSWPQGSISAAIYIDSVPALFSIEEELTKLERETAPYCQITTSLLLSLELSAILTKIEYLALSSSTTDSEETITKSTITTTNTITCHPYDLLYPINALRNLALDASETDLVLSLDADFIFSKEAYAYLTSKNVFNMMRRTMSFSPTAFVVAAFEFRTSESWSKTGMSSSLLSLDPDQVVDQSSSRAARSGIDRRMLEKLCISMDIIPFHSRVVLNHEDDGDNNINDHEDRLLSREWVAKWCRGEVLDYHIKVTEIQVIILF